MNSNEPEYRKLTPSQIDRYIAEVAFPSEQNRHLAEELLSGFSFDKNFLTQMQAGASVLYLDNGMKISFDPILSELVAEAFAV